MRRYSMKSFARVGESWIVEIDEPGGGMCRLVWTTPGKTVKEMLEKAEKLVERLNENYGGSTCYRDAKTNRYRRLQEIRFGRK